MRSHPRTVLYSALLTVAITSGAVAAPPNKPGADLRPLSTSPT